MTVKQVFYNDMAELGRLQELVEQFGEEASFPAPVVMQLNVVLEEVVSNVINYAYQGMPADTPLDVHISYEQPLLTVVVEDKGPAFDPTAAEDPDISLAAEDRPVGGLGIFMVKQMMDTVTYQRRDNINSLTLTKKI